RCAATAPTRKRSRWRATTSSVEVPTEPVAPSSATVRSVIEPQGRKVQWYRVCRLRRRLVNAVLPAGALAAIEPTRRAPGHGKVYGGDDRKRKSPDRRATVEAQHRYIAQQHRQQRGNGRWPNGQIRMEQSSQWQPERKQHDRRAREQPCDRIVELRISRPLDH